MVSFSNHFAILTPIKGNVVLKSDSKIIEGYESKGKRDFLPVYGTSKESLIEKIKSFSGRLKKRYNVLVITENQFSNIQENKDFEFDFTEVATRSQLINQFTI